MPSIAKLSVIISAQTDQFEKAMTSLEKKAVSSAAKLSQPFSSIVSGGRAGLGIFGSAASAFGGPIGQIAGGAGIMGKMLFGAESGWGQTKEELGATLVMVKEIERESRKFGINPAFVRGMRLIEDPANVTFALDKANDLIDKLRSDSGLSKKLKGFGFDSEGVAGGNVANALMQIGRIVPTLKDRAAQMGFLGEIFGDKRADDMFTMFAGGDVGLAGLQGKASRTGLFSAGHRAMEKELRKMEMETKLAEETGSAQLMMAEMMDQKALKHWRRGNLFGWAGSRVSEFAARFGPDFGYKAVAPEEKTEDTAAARFEQKQRDIATAVDTVIERLTKESTVLGKTADEMERLTLASIGANQAQLEGVRNLQMENAERRKNMEMADTTAELEKQLRRSMDLFGKPAFEGQLAALGDRFPNLNPDHLRGLFQQQDFQQRAMGAAGGALSQLMAPQQGARLIMKGSAEEYQLINQQERGLPSAEQLAGAIKSQMDADKRREELLRQAVELLKKQEKPAVINMPP